MVKKYVFDFRWLLYQSVFLVLIFLGVALWDSAEWWFCLIPILIGAVLMIGYGFLFSYRYCFDSDGITLYYCFGIRTSVRWSEIKHIEIRHGRGLPWRDEYRIGYFKTRIPLHEEGSIVKNRKTTAQINMYYHKKIG